MKKYDLILFDFDYTLVDSSQAAFMCYNYAFKKMGFDEISFDLTRSLIGLSLEDIYYKISKDKSLKRADEFRGHFRDCADKVMLDLTVFYDSASDALKFLDRQGFKLGIVSNKYRYRIQDILSREGIARTIDIVVGSEDVSTQKPSGEGILKAISALGISKENSVYIGDSVTDAEAARDAGIDFICVLSGVTSRADFDGFDVGRFLNNLNELPNTLA